MSDKITPEKIAELREAGCRSITPPWVAKKGGLGYRVVTQWSTIGYQVTICSLFDGPTAEFIASAANALPDLLDEVERLRELEADNRRYLERIAELTEMCNQFYADANRLAAAVYSEMYEDHDPDEMVDALAAHNALKGGE